MVNTIVKFLFCFLLCGTSSAQVFNQFACGGDLTPTGCQYNSQTIAPGAVTLVKQANLSADTIQGNATNSAATPQALNPLAAANLMSAVINVAVTATANVTASGVQTVDGVVLANGQSVLLPQQTSSVNDGIYIVNTGGAWTRAINFPTGYVISQNCNLLVVADGGTQNQGINWNLITTGGAITIGTSAQSWSARTIATASPTVKGTVFATTLSSVGAPAVTLGISPPITTVGDCTSFFDPGTGTSGSVADIGNIAGSTGPCVVADQNGHPILNGNGSGPGISGTGCSLSAGTNTDNTGAIIAAGIDTCTLAFGSAFTTAPHCSVGNIGATVIANLTALPTTAHAIFLTAAAGTFNYVCL